VNCDGRRPMGDFPRPGGLQVDGRRVIRRSIMGRIGRGVAGRRGQQPGMCALSAGSCGRLMAVACAEAALPKLFLGVTERPVDRVGIGMTANAQAGGE